jgi:hypothetical protein
MLTEREFLEKTLKDLLRLLPLLIELEKEKGSSEVDIRQMVDTILDRINELRKRLKNR